jgi:hypothetical protein
MQNNADECHTFRPWCSRAHQVQLGLEFAARCLHILSYAKVNRDSHLVVKLEGALEATSAKRLDVSINDTSVCIVETLGWRCIAATKQWLRHDDTRRCLHPRERAYAFGLTMLGVSDHAAIVSKSHDTKAAALDEARRNYEMVSELHFY